MSLAAHPAHLALVEALHGCLFGSIFGSIFGRRDSRSGGRHSSCARTPAAARPPPGRAATRSPAAVPGERTALETQWCCGAGTRLRAARETQAGGRGSGEPLRTHCATRMTWAFRMRISAGW